MKTHFKVNPPFSTAEVSACGRGRRLSSDVRRVDCLLCKDKDSYILAADEYQAKVEADFQAQTPRQIKSVWAHNKPVICQCGNDTWRERPRSLLSYHFVCYACGKSIYPPTETGMCT